MTPPSTPRRPAGEIAKAPATFHVRDHTLRLSKVAHGRWEATVDDMPVPGSFQTEVEAWEAAIRESERLDAKAR